jgi:hypothetical protein
MGELTPDVHSKVARMGGQSLTQGGRVVGIITKLSSASITSEAATPKLVVKLAARYGRLTSPTRRARLDTLSTG